MNQYTEGIHEWLHKICQDLNQLETDVGDKTIEDLLTRIQESGTIEEESVFVWEVINKLKIISQGIPPKALFCCYGMDLIHQAKILNNSDTIAGNLIFEDIGPLLLEEGILLQQHLDRIAKHKHNFKKTTYFLDILTTRGPRAYKVFRSKLKDFNDQFITLLDCDWVTIDQIQEYRPDISTVYLQESNSQHLKKIIREGLNFLSEGQRQLYHMHEQEEQEDGGHAYVAKDVDKSDEECWETKYNKQCSYVQELEQTIRDNESEMKLMQLKHKKLIKKKERCHAEEIENLEKQLEDEYDEMEEDLKEKHEEELRELRETHEKDLEHKLKSIADTNAKHLASLEIIHRKNVQDETKKVETLHKTKLEQQAVAHSKELEDLKRETLKMQEQTINNEAVFKLKLEEEAVGHSKEVDDLKREVQKANDEIVEKRQYMLRKLEQQKLQIQRLHHELDKRNASGKGEDVADG